LGGANGEIRKKVRKAFQEKKKKSKKTGTGEAFIADCQKAEERKEREAPKRVRKFAEWEMPVARPRESSAMISGQRKRRRPTHRLADRVGAAGVGGCVGEQ